MIYYTKKSDSWWRRQFNNWPEDTQMIIIQELTRLRELEWLDQDTYSAYCEMAQSPDADNIVFVTTLIDLKRKEMRYGKISRYMGIRQRR